DEAGDAGQDGGGDLLQGSPDGEVEGVDLDGDAGPRGEDVLAEEFAAAAEGLDVAVEQHGVVGQFPAALAGVAGEHADAAVDVELGVAQGGAGPRGQGVQLGPVLAQEQAERLEHGGALVEGQPAQAGAADRAAVLEGGPHVDAGRGDGVDLLPGDGIQERRARLGGRCPGPVYIAAQ